MAYDPGAIDAVLAAAVGDEPILVAELRLAFIGSAQRSVAAMATSADEDAWRLAAFRLKGLAASFGAVRLMALAKAAGEGPPANDAALRKLRQSLSRL